jgi:hypothetical protein
VIHIQSMAFATFAEIEPLNPAFRKRHPKMRVTVDAEPAPHMSEDLLLRSLAAAFPGLARHQCRAAAADGGVASGGTRILLVPADPTANQAHVFEHLTLEMLAALGDASDRLSGVTCAYADPPERNDVFVECDDADTGALAAWLAAETINGVFAGESATPLYPDVLRCARLIHGAPAHAWTPRRLARGTGIPEARAANALAVLTRARLVQSVDFSMNFSGEPYYRCTAAGLRGAIREEAR